MLTADFFNRDATTVARNLIGKVLRVKHHNLWISAMIIETEAYYIHEKASHASLGYSEKRKALFMPAGTIYMYYARGHDSLNISCQGVGNAVLIKSGIPYVDDNTPPAMILQMQKLNPRKKSNRLRSVDRLCSGQTLLCRSLDLKVKRWDQQQFDPDRFYIEDVGYRPSEIIQTIRLGISKGRDEHLMYRFIDFDHVRSCTINPLTRRGWIKGTDYYIHSGK